MFATSYQFTRTSKYLHRCATYSLPHMDDTTRYKLPRRRRRIVLAAAAVGVALSGGVVAIVVAHRDDATRPNPLAGRPQVVEPEFVAPTPLRVTGVPAPPRIPHDYVPAAVPTSFKLAGNGFTINARVCSMAPVFPLDPPGDQHHTVCWVTKGFGFRPGTRSGTSYVLGHAWAPDPQEVLNKASTRATRDILRVAPQKLDGVTIYPARSLLGARITLRTPEGSLVYAVRLAFGVDKNELGLIDMIMNQHVPKRVVLITCAERNGVDYDYNVVLDARLVSSRRS